MFSLIPRFTFVSVVLLYLSAFAVSSPHVKRTARSSPPSGALVVRGTSTKTGEYSTVSKAIAALPSDGSAQVIFIYGGTYSEQVYITRTGTTTLMGETADTSSYAGNLVTITHSLSATAAGSDDLSGTLRVHKDDFIMYNINVKNTFGVGSQAIALSAYGSGAYYGVGLYGYQDTLLTESGNQFYGYSYIEGAVDYIFGQHSHTFFHECTIASTAAGAITANGAASEGDSLYVFNHCNIIQSSAATSSLTGKVYLGRPWTEYAQVVYTTCTLGALINTAGWEIWSTATPNTQDVVFAEYKSTGSGADNSARASFATILTSSSDYGISSVIGTTLYNSLDKAYLVE